MTQVNEGANATMIPMQIVRQRHLNAGTFRATDFSSLLIINYRPDIPFISSPYLEQERVDNSHSFGVFQHHKFNYWRNFTIHVHIIPKLYGSNKTHRSS
jgi:hypothetical protein